MARNLYNVEEVSKMILEKKILVLTGEENLLKQLPKGNWIGGTIPYFMSEEKGGSLEKEYLFVNDFSSFVKSIKIKVYDEDNLHTVTTSGFDNGFNFIIMPSLVPIQLKFALESRNYDNLYDNPLVGYVAGVDLDDFGKVSTKVFDGSNSQMFEKEAVVMHAELPSDKVARIEIINSYIQNPDGDTIAFFETGFSVNECLVNGKKVIFSDYIANNKIDISLPLITDYSGAHVNIGFESIDAENGVVNFWAPVFKDTIYKQAKPIEDYKKVFNSSIPNNVEDNTIKYSCNCLLNYIHGDLEGNRIALNGSMTFGEIAYNLLNQTFVYMIIE